MLLTWVAPICPHTAEEAWDFIPKNEDKSIFFNNWLNLDINQFENCKISDNNWNDIVEVKKAVSKSLEEKRGSGVIGSSLDAYVTIYCSKDLYNILSVLGEELKFIFITSNAFLKNIEEINQPNINPISINDHNLYINIENTKNKKCDRCWHKCKTVGENKKYANICNRCITNVYGKGEIRINA